MLPVGMKVTSVLDHGKDLLHAVSHSASTHCYTEKETEANQLAFSVVIPAGSSSLHNSSTSV